MKIRIVSPGEHDRHEAEVRFLATVDGRQISVTITDYALARMSEALAMPQSEPLIVYAASGQLLVLAVEDAVSISGEAQATYLVTHANVLRVTGCEPGLPHVPKRWMAH